jgi:hypothetical protein
VATLISPASVAPAELPYHATRLAPPTTQSNYPLVTGEQGPLTLDWRRDDRNLTALVIAPNDQWVPARRPEKRASLQEGSMRGNAGAVVAVRLPSAQYRRV